MRGKNLIVQTESQFHKKSLAWCITLLMGPAALAQENAATGHLSTEEGESVLFEQEIVVTATRREQLIQDVPMSITAFSGVELEKKGAEDFLDFARQIPGVNINETNRGSVDVGIRGIRSQTSGVGGATVGYYIDEISVSAPNATPLLATFDLNRVEVLRGPQGTLFGEGSLGGTIRFITNKPDTNEFTGKFKVSYSSIEEGDNNNAVAGMINLPLIEDELALRIVATHNSNGGFIDNIAPGLEEEDVNDSEIQAARIILGWTPNDQLSITPGVSYQKSKFRSSAAETLDADENDPAKIVSVGDLQQFKPSLSAADNEDEFIQPSIVVEYDFGPMVFTSATNYFDSELNIEIISRTNEVLTQEFRLVSTTSGSWQWVAGAFFKDQKADTTIDVVVPGIQTFFSDTKTELTQQALYGTLTYNFWEKFRVDFGGRFFHENVDESSEQRLEFFLPPPGVLLESFNEGDGSNDEFIPRINLSYDVSADMMAYASIAKGFRRGQVNRIDSRSAIAPPGVPAITDSDTLWSYELGFKAQFLDGKAYFSGALFYIDWDDIQISDSVSFGGSDIDFVRNGGKATSTGFEFDAGWAVTSNFTLSVNGTFSRAELAETIANVGEDGDDLPTSPDYQINAVAEYSMPVFDGARGSIRFDVSAVDGQTSGLGAPAELITSDSYVLANLRVGAAWDRFEVNVFAENLFDKRAEYSFDAINDGEIIRNTPRTIGVELLTTF